MFAGGGGGRAPNPGLATKLEQERRMKEGISGHKTGLPKKLLELFAPRPPLEFKPAMKHRKPAVPYQGMAHLVNEFAEPEEPEYEPPVKATCPPSPRKFVNPELVFQARVEQETKAEKKIRIMLEKKEKADRDIEEGARHFDPSADPNAQGDPFKTLFVARLSYEVTEKMLIRTFEEYGPVKQIRLVHNTNTAKPRGYAFIEFEHKNDMKNAYKNADGRKVESKRVVVDVERGRTVPNWRPRRLGGGKGGESRAFKESKNPSKRLAAGLTASVSAAVGLPPPPSAGPSGGGDRARDADRDRERADRERERARQDAEKDRAREKDRERERERPRDRDRGREANGKDHRAAEPERGERDAPRDRDRERERGERDAPRERGAERSDRKRERDAPRERDRDAPRSAPRDRDADDGRSSKRHRDEEPRKSGRDDRRRERDMI